MMKKFIFILMAFTFVSCNQDEDVIDLNIQNKQSNEKEKEKIDICHYDEETGEYESINVSINAMENHLNHGDILGDCNDNLICHWADPVLNIWEPLLVKDEDLQEHLDHGDFLGSCGPNPGDNFTYIPDERFEQALIDQLIDSDNIINKRVFTSDISEVKNLNVAGKEITDLTGIQDFEILNVLNFANNDLRTVDLSKNTLLTLLRFNNNMEIKSIDLSKNEILVQLFCYNNGLETLDLRNNTQLVDVYCYDNEDLQSLNIKSGNNGRINRFRAQSNSSLQFITVDDPASANLGLSPYTLDKWRKGNNSTYN